MFAVGGELRIPFARSSFWHSIRALTQRNARMYVYSRTYVRRFDRLDIIADKLEIVAPRLFVSAGKASDSITGGIRGVIQTKLALLILKTAGLLFALLSLPRGAFDRPRAHTSALLTPPKVSLSSNQIIAPIRYKRDARHSSRSSIIRPINRPLIN